MRAKFTVLAFMLSLAMMVTFSWKAAAEEAPRISKEEVQGMGDDPDLLIIDVRAGGDWDRSQLKIKGALREDPTNVQSWMNKYSKERTLVFYCA